MRLVDHLEKLDGWEITFGVADVGYQKVNQALKPVRELTRARAEARTGLVFQNFDLFDHLTALENVVEAPIWVYGEVPHGGHGSERLLARVGLAGSGSSARRLSGGQQQRVAIARALAIQAAGDAVRRADLRARSRAGRRGARRDARSRRGGMTMIVVTHEMRFAREVADRVVFMDDGLIVGEGLPDDVLGRPRHERTQRFLRLVEAKVEAVP